MADHAAPVRGLVAVGTVIKPHGIRGELCVESHADSPLLFGAGRTLLLASSSSGGGKGRPKPYAVTACREHQDRLLVTLAGIADRDAAETLRGLEILVPATDLPEPDEGEVYLHALLGARVETADGNPVGVFEGILEGGAQAEYDTWIIAAPGGREILLPAVPDFLLELDPEAGLIRIDPPPGLLELYLSPEPEKGPEKHPRPERKPRPKTNPARSKAKG